ncbi:hypothetical protein ACOYW6_04995 [Parablastomonas sp. CN1-191]|uniref:hypothetical protein n=1 Tax=Parablastomonas sp. CN1-191 TaxID=3400908 RepID=UPI003BF91304
MRGLVTLIAAAVLFTAPAEARAACYGPAWQTVDAPDLGLSVLTSADTWRDYWIDREGFLSISMNERSRPGGAIAGRCSDFTVSVKDFGDSTVADPKGLFAMLAGGAKGLRDYKLVSSSSGTFQGLPAYEYVYQFTIDYFSTPARHRVMMVLRGNRFYQFDSSWGDDGPVPDDSRRIFNSIRFTPPVTDPNARSRALLDMTVAPYWLHPGYPDRIVMDANLKRIADSKRDKERAIVQSYGYWSDVRFVRREGNWRVFLADHEHAKVEWWIIDDGNTISGLMWKKIG